MVRFVFEHGHRDVDGFRHHNTLVRETARHAYPCGGNALTKRTQAKGQTRDLATDMCSV